MEQWNSIDEIPEHVMNLVGFNECLARAAEQPELVANFNRLSGCTFGVTAKRGPLDAMVDHATGYDQVLKSKEDEDTGKFVEFVRECVWLRLTPEVRKEIAIGALAGGIAQYLSNENEGKQ